MANSPVQIILNSSDFIEALENQGGGHPKDFFSGDDAAFAVHQQAMIDQLEEIKNLQLMSSFGRVGYAKVTLQPGALAKSHRPTSQLFKNDVARVVGGGDLGELFVELTPQSIDIISNKVEQAEVQTRYNTRGEASPSKLRSEIGAIQEIAPYTESDKRNFSVADAVEWLAQPQTGGFYLVELFEEPPAVQDWDLLSTEKRQLFNTFVEGLLEIGNGLVVLRIKQTKDTGPMLGIKLENSGAQPVIKLKVAQRSTTKSQQGNEINQNAEQHSRLLGFLGRHPLVKKIALPPIVTQSDTVISPRRGETFTVPQPETGRSYPKICVVDGGVSQILGPWIEERWGLISANDKNENHGSFIATLAVAGKALNGDAVCGEPDGCKIIDLDIFPKQNYRTYFPEPLGFFDELEAAVQELKAKTGVRIFNFSLNFSQHASGTGYSLVAQRLDKIAEDNDVIFIVSAGNTRPHEVRREWPADNLEALRILASSRNDTIKTPAESCRNMSVSALNPPHLDNVIAYALSNYSCRGPGLRVGLKPDLAHIGGAGTRHTTHGYGLLSLDANGVVVDGCGTSYAAPNVSKTLACLDHAIEGVVSRETLFALSIHSAVVPDSLKHKDLKNIAKDLVGFGKPGNSQEILNGDPSAITLVFANRITNGNKMSFRFSWPASLVHDGKCRGHARLTIVSTPEFDYRYGAEFVRVNVEAYLRQLQDDDSYLGRLHAVYTPDGSDGGQKEKDLIEHGFKWSPVKVYEKTFPRGVGPTTEWSLDVEYLTRDGARMPAAGVPFTAILTISDPGKQAPVFNDMRQMLTSLGVQAVDIQTAARVSTRI
ncbi:S8 family peptidase [[Flexibacter] sp. ATCC 35208]|uniref:S8 family peptidase n=1 Tax=[Flexibacter] sp. ATCC 35208 TaxID=1936242 RepID=UPI0009C7431B|nr:S8 family peptidase [[Flexibacter] sp. ATCC 35208]OMP80146.1 hypothetical protein BW716_06540 [[Flexibacter] sp. ATCC 35208]